MVDQGNEQVEEQLAAILHLLLHGAAALESVTSPDYESEIVCSQLGVIVGRVGVCEASRRQNSAALNTRLKSLLAERELLQLFQTVSLSGTIEHCIFQDRPLIGEDDGLIGAIAVAAVF